MTDNYQYGDINLASAPANTVQTEVFPLLVNASTTATPPVYATLLTGTLTSLLTSSFLSIGFTNSVFHTGVGGINVAFSFRFRIDGGLLAASGGTTGNELTGRIVSLAYSRRVPVTRGLHTVAVEWAKFGPLTQTMSIFAAALPDLFHANLTLQEQRDE